MNFNFNFKDMPGAPGASIRRVTNAPDWHRTGKSGIKWGSLQPTRDGDVCWKNLSESISVVVELGDCC